MHVSLSLLPQFELRKIIWRPNSKKLNVFHFPVAQIKNIERVIAHPWNFLRNIENVRFAIWTKSRSGEKHNLRYSQVCKFFGQEMFCFFNIFQINFLFYFFRNVIYGTYFLLLSFWVTFDGKMGVTTTDTPKGPTNPTIKFTFWIKCSRYHVFEIFVGWSPLSLNWSKNLFSRYQNFDLGLRRRITYSYNITVHSILILPVKLHKLNRTVKILERRGKVLIKKSLSCREISYKSITPTCGL